MEESRDIRIHNTNFLISSSLILHIKIIFCLVLSKREWKTKKHWRFFFISNTSNHTFLTTYLFHFSLPSPPFLTYHTQIRFLSLNSFPAPSPRSRPPVFERCTDCLPTLIITIIIIIKKTKTNSTRNYIEIASCAIQLYKSPGVKNN